MMPLPVTPAEVADIDWVFCTHRHTDHMDPETLGIISKGGNARFIIPRAIRDFVVEKVGLDPERLICVNAGEKVEVDPGLVVTAIPAAHEKLEQNDKGEYVALGYVIGLDGFSIYHAGDCLPYNGLSRVLAGAGKIDLALLPANGRDAERTAGGIPGNFTIDEALELFAEVPFGRMIVGHFGMFDFNTVDPVQLREKIRAAGLGGLVVVPEVDVAYKEKAGRRAEGWKKGMKDET